MTLNLYLHQYTRCTSEIGVLVKAVHKRWMKLLVACAFEYLHSFWWNAVSNSPVCKQNLTVCILQTDIYGCLCPQWTLFWWVLVSGVSFMLYWVEHNAHFVSYCLIRVKDYNKAVLLCKTFWLWSSYCMVGVSPIFLVWTPPIASIMMSKVLSSSF